jgi:hypothetical protein
LVLLVGFMVVGVLGRAASATTATTGHSEMRGSGPHGSVRS